MEYSVKNIAPPNFMSSSIAATDRASIGGHRLCGYGARGRHAERLARAIDAVTGEARQASDNADKVTETGGRHAGNVGEGPDQRRGTRPFPQSDRGGCHRLRARRARLLALQRSPRPEGSERLLLLRGLPERGRVGSASGSAALCGLARGCRYLGRPTRGDALRYRV